MVHPNLYLIAGWTILGSTIDGIPAFANLKCHRTQIENNNDNVYNIVEQYCKREFVDNNSEDKADSVEDKKWRKQIEQTLIRTETGRFQVGLPFKQENLVLPDNRKQALSRLFSLKNKFIKDEKYFAEYKGFIDEMIINNYTSKVEINEHNNNNKWYLVHFGVRHAQKQKLRVVFDASLKYENVSLNQNLLIGPDYISSLVGILLRFREHQFAFITDIKKMFYQIEVIPEHRNYLRFFWFTDGDVNKVPEEYKVNVHIFGSVSSPSIANYVLKETTKIKQVENYNNHAKHTIQRNFYIDDCLKSVPTEQEAIELYNEIKEILKINKFELHGLISNSKKLIQSVDTEDLSENLKQIDLDVEKLPTEKVLGLSWNAEQDTISARLIIANDNPTKRGILSNIFSIYDPLGFLSPIIIPSKLLFQNLSSIKLSWDEKIPMNLYKSYQKSGLMTFNR